MKQKHLSTLSRGVFRIILACGAAASVAETALANANVTSDWIPDPILAYSPLGWNIASLQHYRFNSDSEFECYSDNGTTCTPGLPDGNVASWRPVSCTTIIDERLALNGYDTQGHWCNQQMHRVAAKLDGKRDGPWRKIADARVYWYAPGSYSAFPIVPQTGWKKVGNQYFRINENGYFSCYSEDGQSCKRGERTKGASEVKPRVCNKKAEYDDAAHWCNTVFARTFADWQQYAVLGFPFEMAKNLDGKMMCKSADGEKCFDIRYPSPPSDEDVQYIFCEARDKIKSRAFNRRWCDSAEIVEKISGDLSGEKANFAIPRFSISKSDKIIIGLKNNADINHKITMKLGTSPLWYESVEPSSADLDLPMGMSLLRLTESNAGVIDWASTVAVNDRIKMSNEYWAGLEFEQAAGSQVKVGISVMRIRNALRSIELNE